MKKSILIFTLTILGMALALPIQADDTNIYGSGSISVEPNVLIIFDTSGSMTREDVPGEYYDPNTTYTGSYTRDAVYEWSETWVCTRYRRGRCVRGYWQSSYLEFASDVHSLACTTVKNELETDGTTEGRIYDSSDGYVCGGTSKTLYMGNWLNYDASSTGDMRSRTEVAKEVTTNLIRNTDGVRFGLMRFNYNTNSSNSGGRIIKPIQSVTGDDAYRQELIDAVNALPASGNTPLAEALAEAGLYFAGMNSWYNSYSTYSDDVLTSSNTYTSPMQYRCQKNYIILMTDGAPTQDNNYRLASGSYINGDTIGDYDNDGNSGDSTSDSSSDYLDDVAKYLYDNDCNPTMGAGDLSFEKQNIITYTIGFQSDQQLLQDAATNGGGEYYVANSISGLSEAFESIISKIMEVNAVFVSPVVPVSRMNRTYAGNSLYVGFFKPQNSGRWSGNVKKYGLSDYGDILTAGGLEATNDDGSIKDNARSYWSSTADGPDVTAGGVGEMLLDNTSRNLYTYLGSVSGLTDTGNAFSTANTGLTAAALGVTTAAERTSIINDIIGGSLDWKMGDVLHSQPAVVHYDTDDDGDDDVSYIFVGTNGGMMHAFYDNDGSETWGFIPPDQLSRLQLLSDSTTNHDYYVDGPPSVYDNGTGKTLFFGERRGGYNYYSLDITDPVAPVYKYSIGQGLLAAVDTNGDGTVDGSDANLGQSWATPTDHTIRTGTGTSDYEDVLLLPGGYDTNQDLDTPAAVDTVGRAVFTVDVSDGSVSALNFNAANFTGMNNCFTDVMGFDANGDSYTNRVYAGDLAGNMWAFEDDDTTPADTIVGGDGTWSGRKLFSAGAVDGVQRKIFYSPDAVAEYGEDMIFFGTGDRADPEETGVVNRIYAIRNDWEDSSTFATLTESDLVDVTDNLIQNGTESEQEAVKTALDNSRGWYFELEDSGEKIISSVVVYAGVLYFTTYTPEDSSSTAPSTDPCTSITGRGTARFYAVNYLTGAAVKDFSSVTETDTEGNVIDGLGKSDRSKVIGTSIASSPVIAVLPKGAVILIGVEGGIEKEDPVEQISMHKFYWRRASN